MPPEDDQSHLQPNESDVEKARLEMEKDKLEAKKTNLEIADLEYQSRRFPRWMRLFGPALTAVLSLVVSTGALLMSIRTQKSQGDLEHAIKEHEALRSDIDIATDASKGRPRQIAGIWNLRRYLSTADKFTAASALGAVLADEDTGVHTAVAGVVSGSIISAGNEGGKELVTIFFGSRDGPSGIISYQNYTMAAERKIKENEVSTDAKQRGSAAVQGRASENEKLNQRRPKRDGTKAVIQACRSFLSGIQMIHGDLSGAYLVDADFTFSDLTGTDLSGTDLSHANLSGANLSIVVVDATTIFARANILNVQASGDLKEVALKRGAVEMDYASWQRWKGAGWPTPGAVAGEEWEKWRNHKFAVDDNGKPII